MNIKLHEIEIGAADLHSTQQFYSSVLGLPVSVDQAGLKVFHTGVQQLDLDFSSHLPANHVQLSFLCDDITEVIKTLEQQGISYSGPAASHLGMLCIAFKDPSGNNIKINQATEQSPEWLQQSFANK
jgi:predicted enzyme related to lactoylglutathione lyase